MKIVVSMLRSLTWPAVFFWAANGLLVGGLTGLFLVPQNPIVIKDVREVSAVVARGRYLELEFNLTRNQLCDARVERWLWRWTTPDEGKPIPQWVQLDSFGANPPTELRVLSRYALIIPIPKAIDTGEWFYWSRTWDNCGLRTRFFGENVREGANIPVTISDQP